MNGPEKKLKKLKVQILQNFSNYTMSTSVYRVARAEKLYNMPFPEKSANDVHIIFLFKKDERGNDFINTNKLEIKAPDVPYYTDSGHYNEAKWMAKESELRMEFYIDLIRTYWKKGDSTLGIFCGSKYTVASLVRNNAFLDNSNMLIVYPRPGDNLCASHASEITYSDYSFSNGLSPDRG